MPVRDNCKECTYFLKLSLESPEGKKLLSGFDLNSKAPIWKILKRPVKAGNGAISIIGLIPKRDIAAPKIASHVSITGIISYLDLSANTHVLNTQSVTIALDKKQHTITLQPAVSDTKGTVIYLLQIGFMQETNRKLYDLKNKDGRGLGILKCGE